MSRTISEQANTIASLAATLDAEPNDENSRRALSQHVESLHRTIRPDDYFLTQQASSIARDKTLSALLQLGVINNMPELGEDISVSELAQQSGVDERIISISFEARLMRILTASGIIQKTGSSSYSLTRFSKEFHHGLDAQGRWVWHMEEICRPNLGEYLRSKTIDEVNDATHCPLNWEDGHEGILWLSAKLDEDEDLAAVAKFKHAKRYDSQRFPVLDMFPFEMLEHAADPGGRVFFVDIGGGEGWPMRLIRQRYEKLVVAGDWILQEHAQNLTSLDMNTLPGVKVYQRSFFEPQEIRGAVAYYLRRILQNWDDAKAIRILSHIAAAMAKDSRLLICELVAPDQAEPGSDLTPFWMDYALMQIGGKVRTGVEFERLLLQAGLVLVHVWPHPKSGGWAILEARLW